MRVIITGGAGFVGARLARVLLEKGEMVNQTGAARPIETVVLFDQVAPAGLASDPRIEVVTGRIDDPVALGAALGEAPDSIFHFAAAVSGAAEADLKLGLAANLDGTRLVLDLAAASGRRPKVVFASSFAVYGDGGEVVRDETTPWPRSSYGVQKLCGELLVGDYHRRGLIDGRSMRFPTIAVRPGAANAANSSFISAVIREPAAGRAYACPVPGDMAISLMSPGRLIAAILRVHDLDSDAYGWPRSLLMPAVKVTVDEMLDALEARLGPEARALVDFAPDQRIIPMVKSWPLDIEAERAGRLGIVTDASAAAIVEDYLAEQR